MRKILFLTGALALASISTAALAEGPFVRVEGGHTQFHANGGSDGDDAWSLRGGYAFNPNFAVEGFYSQLYDETDNGASAKVDGFGVGVVGKKNFGPEDTGFFVDGRVGVARNKAKLGVAGLGSDSDSSTRPYYGVGAGYDFNRNFGLSLNYDWNKVSAFDLDGKAKTLTVGAEYRF
ncbi:MAG: porin family protein [Lysobacteraceae bacterium]